MSEICRICGNSTDNRLHTSREMMFGSRDEFKYLECVGCGTVQIVDIPDLARYYPKDYYSLAPAVGPKLSRSMKSRVAARLASSFYLSGKGLIGKYLAESKEWIGRHFPPFLKEAFLRITISSPILDFGCGQGELLQTLSYFGFRNLTGADTFILSSNAVIKTV